MSPCRQRPVVRIYAGAFIACLPRSVDPIAPDIALADLAFGNHRERLCIQNISSDKVAYGSVRVWRWFVLVSVIVVHAQDRIAVCINTASYLNQIG